MVDISKLEEQRRALDAKIRAARREAEQAHYLELGRDVAAQYGGGARSVEERAANAREALKLPEAAPAKRRGGSRRKPAGQQAGDQPSPRPVEQPQHEDHSQQQSASYTS